LEFLKASVADLITLVVFIITNSKGGGDGDSRKSCAAPANFYHFRRPQFNFSLSPSLLRPLAKLAETKVVARINVEENQSKKIEKRLLNRLR
jgi:hypothetical protein